MQQPESASVTVRGVTAEVSVEEWTDDPRYVRVVLRVEPATPGLDTEAYSVLVKAPEAA